MSDVNTINSIKNFNGFVFHCSPDSNDPSRKYRIIERSDRPLVYRIYSVSSCELVATFDHEQISESLIDGTWILIDSKKQSHVKKVKQYA